MTKPLPLLIMMLFGIAGTASRAQCPGNFLVTLYSTDFESDNGGFVESGNGDWEYGTIPVIITGANCGSSTVDSPGGAFSGTMGWGTLLDDCYQNLGAFIGTGFTTDLSDPSLISAELNFAQWFEVFVDWDYLIVTANGTEIYRNDTLEDSSTWLLAEANLTPYLGQSAVVIEFNLWSSTVVNRAGWYIDDVSVTACSSEPLAILNPESPQFKAWPVPASDVLNIEPSLAMGPVLGWTLWDATGRVMAEGPGSGDSAFRIDVSALHGVAVLDLRTRDGHQRQRILLE